MSCFTFSQACIEGLRTEPTVVYDMALGALYYAGVLAAVVAAFYSGLNLPEIWSARHVARTALRDVMAQRCAGYEFYGSCWCRSASTCQLYRCHNCDMPTDETGKALLDDFCMPGVDRHAGPCPYCGGPMRKP